jgi:uncharacterized membrane protein
MTETTPPLPVDSNLDASTGTFVQRLMVPSNRLTWVAAMALMIALVLWLSFTPSGILGKADAVGYAVCHRITVRSFLFPNGKQLPMCARCTGTFLGVLIGLLGPGLILRRRHAGEFPPMPIVIAMLLFSIFWAFDGTNSFTLLLPGNIPHLYEPTNFLRLFTGMFHGITLGSLILPVVNATLWVDVTNERTVKSFWEYLLLIGIGGVLILMVLSGLGVFLYPLAVLSSIGALSVLAAISTIIMATFLDQENRAHTLHQALPLMMFGMAMAISLVGVIDALRFAMFGTWEGFVF